jgi:hypothetical protein
LNHAGAGRIKEVLLCGKNGKYKKNKAGFGNIENRNYLSKRPKRRRAASIELGLFVAAMTMT